MKNIPLLVLLVSVSLALICGAPTAEPMKRPSPSPRPAPVYPGKFWETRTPEEASLDPVKLDALRDYVGGRGCVVRHGYMVYSWGDQALRGDVYSACKPWFSHFLFKAVEEGKIPSLDQKVSVWEPRLNDLNPALAFKDREITWRHLANQTSCYGAKDKPGGAFNYNDYQMALFWDTLFLKVYGATYDTVDAKVLCPELTDILRCQDKPTFMVSGSSSEMGRLGVSMRDFARFGLLYLRQGNWRGQQLISPEHVKTALTSPLPSLLPDSAEELTEMIPGQRTIGRVARPQKQGAHGGSYSWLWWVNGVDRNGKRRWPHAPTDIYGAFGGRGNAMVVIPSLDLVVCWSSPKLDEIAAQNEALQLMVESVRRDLTTQGDRFFLDGQPFFYLCDTGWDLFMRLDREEADEYLKNRADKGFNVIMAILIGFKPGEDDRNAYGEPPLIDKDPARPNEKYFRHVDYIVNKANSLGLLVAIAPAWSDWLYKNVPPGPHPFNAKNARSFGEYVGRRYKNNDVVWVIGGDRNPAGYEEILRAMAAGLDEGDGNRDFLTTFHGEKNGQLMPPEGIYYERLCSSHLFGAERWLDFHGAYSGHQWAYPTYRLIEQDRAMKPTRPVIDLEPCYENHPYHADGSRYHANPGKWDKTTRGTAALIREQAYWAMLAGAAGHTYAANDVWGFYDPARSAVERLYHCNTHWRRAMDFPGAVQMGIMRRLFESRPWHTLEPDQGIVVAGQGSGENHIQAARASDGRFLFVYVPRGNKLTIDMTKMKGRQATAYWFNPRDGKSNEIGKFPGSGTRDFSPPSCGVDNDWVLVLDDATQNFPTPGAPGRQRMK